MLERYPESTDPQQTIDDSSLKIRCPHCQENVPISTDADFGGVTCHACGSSFGLIDQKDNANLQAGQCVGRFELVRRLGQGGFGAVWEALDPHLDRTVALKVPRRGELTAAEAETFLREARAAAQIRHTNVVGLHEVGRDRDRIYLVSDFIPGESLAERLKRDRFSQREAVELTATLAEALQHVHAHEIVHRDLKPANVLLDNEGRPHLTDFGLARRVAADMTLTFDGQVVGTPSYMAPEQARGDAQGTDRLSDIYSLGVMFYELLTGELPFRGTPQAILRQLARDEPRSPRRLNPRISRDLETICLKCLQKEPHRRYTSAGALSDDLRRVQRGEPIAARPISRVARAVRWSRRRPFAAALVATLTLVAILAPLEAWRSRGLAHRAAASREAAVQSERQRKEELYIARMFAIQHACEGNDMQRAETLLESLVPQSDEPDLRGFEWYYWRDQTRRGLLWEKGPFGQLQAVAIAPDGKFLAYGGLQGVFGFLDLQSGELKEQQLLDENEAPLAIYSLAFSPDSRWLAIGSGGHRLRVMDTTTRQLHCQLATAGPCAADVTFSHDGTMLAASQYAGTVELWSNLNPATHRVIPVTSYTGRSLALSRDGSQIATSSVDYYGHKGELHLLDGETGKVLARRETETAYGWGLEFAPDQQSLLSPRGPTVERLDAATLETLDSVAHDSISAFGPVEVTPDGHLLLTGGLDGSLMSYSLPDLQLVKSWPGHLDQLMDIAIFPDGQKMVTCGHDGYLKCWKLDAPQHVGWVSGLPTIRWLRFSADGTKIFLTAFDGELAVAQARLAQSGELLWEIREANNQLSPCLTPDGQTLVLGMREGEVRFVDACSGNVIERLHEHRSDRFIMWCSASPDGRWLATSDGRPGGPARELSEEIVLWDLDTRQVANHWPAHDRRAGPTTFGPGSDELFSFGWDKCIRRWRIPSGELMAEYRMGIRNARGLLLMDDHNTLVAVDTDGTIWRWALADGTRQPAISSRDGTAWEPILHATDHSLLIPVGPLGDTPNKHGLVKFVDTRTWETKTVLDAGPAAVMALAMSPDGKTLLVGDHMGNVYRWHVER